MHRKTEITIETDQVLTITRGRSTRTWCGQCQCEVNTVSLAEIKTLMRFRGRLRKTAGTQNWHLVKHGAATTLVCLESVLKAL